MDKAKAQQLKDKATGGTGDLSEMQALAAAVDRGDEDE